jgi:Trk K+ transport system NAD-binding subunit
MLTMLLRLAAAEVVGQSIREANFRSRFHAAVIAIKRRGIPVEWKGPIGEEVLQAGDVLLLDIKAEFWTSPEVIASFEKMGASGQTKTYFEFMLPMLVGPKLAGRTIRDSGLRRLPSAFLVAVERGGEVQHAVSPEELLEEGDILWFATSVNSVRFIRNIPGLLPQTEEQSLKLKDVVKVERRLVQAVVGPGSPLVGRTPRDLRFRDQFNAAVVAVARQGERIQAKPGDIPLQSSDILLVRPARRRNHMP